MKKILFALMLCLCFPVSGISRDGVFGPNDPHLRRLYKEGSYRNSCFDVRVFDGKIHAKCRRKNGSLNPFAQFRLGRGHCDDIMNDNGELRCVRREQHDMRYRDDRYGRKHEPRFLRHNTNLALNANFHLTCKNIRIHEDVLHATCRKRNGHWNITSLPLDERRCRDITNQNGMLFCH